MTRAVTRPRVLQSAFSTTRGWSRREGTADLVVTVVNDSVDGSGSGGGDSNLKYNHAADLKVP